MVGWPSSGGTWMSVMPRTFSSTPRISTAILRRVSRSGPVILMAFSASMPEAASWTLSWMYCEKAKVDAGEAPCAARRAISAISSLLVEALAPFVERLQRHEELDVGEAVGVGAVVGPAVLGDHRLDLGKLLTSRRMRLA